jgi:methionyl-tRNA synthetase
VTGETRKVATESGSAVEWTEEENYKFRLSAFQDRLITWLTEDGVVHPAWLREELLTTLKSQTLPDLSISRPRSRLSWGIPVPGDEQHTIYVWVDALTNYLTVLGYPWAAGEGGGVGRDEGWPADVQVVGKDIVRYAIPFPPSLRPADFGLKGFTRSTGQHYSWPRPSRPLGKSSHTHTGQWVTPRCPNHAGTWRIPWR